MRTTRERKSVLNQAKACRGEPTSCGIFRRTVEVSSDGQHLDLVLLADARYASLSFRPNVTPIASVLDSFRDANLSNPFMDAFVGLGGVENPEALRVVMNQFPGDVFAAGQLAAAELQGAFNGLLPTYQNGYGNYVTPMADTFRGQTCRPKNYRNEYWASPTGRWVERGAQSGYYGYDLANFGIAFGVSRKINSRNHIGIAFGYDCAKLDMNSISQKDEMNSLHVATYGGYVDSGRFFDWHLGYGKNFHETDRRIVVGSFLGNPHAKYDDNILSAGMMYGRRFGAFLPSVGVEFVQIWTPAFSESGGNGSDLRGLKSDYISLEVPVGFRLRNTYKNFLTPEFRTFWVPQLCDDRSGVGTAFVAGGSEFVVETGDLGWQHGRIGGGLNARLSSCVDASLNYDASIYSGHTRQTASGTITVRF